MKITAVECLILAGEHPMVRVETDAGIVGWGECFRDVRLKLLMLGSSPGRA